MHKLFPSRGAMPRLLSITLLTGTVAAGWLLVPDGHGQLAPLPRTVSVDSLTPLLAQLSKQQEQINTNQTKIEAQIDALKEQMRQAKIYSARSR